MATCYVLGCDGKTVGKGLCRKHYMRVARHGEVSPNTRAVGASLIERFWSRVRVLAIPTVACMEWKGHLNEWGYGQIKVEGKMVAAHRLAWQLHTGQEIPEGLLVCHSCDNPACVNPEHLFLGTNQDNVDDMITKGRQASSVGECNANAKLNEKVVLIIRNAAEGYKELARRYNISVATVKAIRARRIWGHLV